MKYLTTNSFVPSANRYKYKLILLKEIGSKPLEMTNQPAFGKS